MLSNKFFPYSSMQEINLDWILTKVKNLMRFLPDDGSVGQILRRTAHGAEWSNEQGGGGAVTSVNGQTGDVVLAIPDSTSDLINDSGFVDAAGAAAAAPVQKVNGQTGTVTINKTSVGLGNVANVLQYSASNPPPYPVTSVNGQTGTVIIPSGGITLLWTNPNPTATYAAQSISIDMTSYKAAIIEFNYTDTSYGYSVIAAKDGLPMQANCITNIMSASIGNVVYRTAQVTASAIVISDCYRKAFNATTAGTVDNTRMIPQRIYGIM